MVKAEIKLGSDNNKWIVVNFPFHPVIVNAMSTVPGSIYDKNRKIWGVPYANKAVFERIMSDFLIQWEGEEVPSVIANGGISENTISKYPIIDGYSVEYNDEGEIINFSGFKTKPWGEFQVKGFNLLVNRSFLILADDAGLGKSWQVGNAIEAHIKLGNAHRALILAKASLLYNWRDEINIHTHLKPIVLAGTVKQRMKLYSDIANLDDWNVLIMSYENFRGDIHNIEHLNKLKKIDIIVLDEGHKIKNPKSKIGVTVREYGERYLYKYILTATPLPNSPLESYNYLKFGKVINKGYYQFEHRYAIKGGWGGNEIIGYKNMNELKNYIQKNMLRRRKKDKLKDLPEVVFKTIPLELTEKQLKSYNAVKKEIMSDLRDTNLRNISSTLTKLLRLQQITDSLELIGVEPHKNNSIKLIALDDLLEDLIDQGLEKVILFSRFKSMVDILSKRYEKYNPAIIHGDTDAQGISEKKAIKQLQEKYGTAWDTLSVSEKETLIKEETTAERQQQVYKFQNDDSCKLFIGTAPACREGLTLTKATNVIFLDTEWSPAYVEQAYSRAHRIGQKNAVTVYFLVATGTIDEYIQAILKRKETIVQTMIDEGIGSIGEAKTREIIAEMIGEKIRSENK